MGGYLIVAATLGIVLAAQPLTEAAASVTALQKLTASRSRPAEPIQYGDPEGRRPPGHERRAAPGPRAYPGWRGEPGWRGAPAWRGPPGWSGRPYWYGRPWVRRPHYGTIFAGVALGTIISVAAIGYVPPRPHPDLCWYWADPYGETGYWDYC
jgi:hypothetical protein